MAIVTLLPLPRYGFIFAYGVYIWHRRQAAQKSSSSTHPEHSCVSTVERHHHDGMFNHSSRAAASHNYFALPLKAHFDWKTLSAAPLQICMKTPALIQVKFDFNWFRNLLPLTMSNRWIVAQQIDDMNSSTAHSAAFGSLASLFIELHKLIALTPEKFSAVWFSPFNNKQMEGGKTFWFQNLFRFLPHMEKLPDSIIDFSIFSARF